MKLRVAQIKDLKEGEFKEVMAGDTPILLIRWEGQFYAMGSKCPHYGAPLAKGTLCQNRLTCPWHQSTFDIRNGDIVEPPTYDALPYYPVSVVGRDVFVDMPEEPSSRRMMPMSTPDYERDSRLFVIIGGGAAGSAAAETLRQEGYQGRIRMFSTDSHRPYDRPNCSKGYLAGSAPADWLELRPEDYYSQYGIAWEQRRVVSLDVRTRDIELEKGGKLTPDGVIIATGGSARPLNVPGGDLPGVLTLRTWDDSDAILAAAPKGSHTIIIGDSYIGMEVAASLKSRDVNVTVVSRGSVPFHRTLGDEVGRIFQDIHEKHGVQFEFNRSVKAIERRSEGLSVIFNDGDVLTGDLVVAGIGIRLNTDFLKGVVLNRDGGVSVDQTLKIADGVYAVGDIAAYPSAHLEKRVRIEHWRLALQHGRLAAKNLLGHNEPFTGVPFFWTEQYDFAFDYAGYGDWDSFIMTGKPDELDFVVYYTRNDQLVAAAGTRSDEINAFSDLMQLGQLDKYHFGHGRLSLEDVLAEGHLVKA